MTVQSNSTGPNSEAGTASRAEPAKEPSGLRVGMLLDFYKPYLSGVTSHVSSLAEHLAARGSQVFIFTFGDPAKSNGQTIYSPALPFSFQYGDARLAFGIRYSPTALRLLQSADIFHVHHPFLSGRLAIRYARRLDKPVIFTSHTRYDLHLEALFPRITHRVGQKVMYWLLRSLTRRCSATIAPSWTHARTLREWGVTSPVEVVTNGIDLEVFNPEGPAASRSTLGLKAGQLVFLYVGRLGKEKNLSLLIDSFGRLIDHLHESVLILIGDGPDRRRLETLARSYPHAQILFLGAKRLEEIPPLLRMADVFVTPSRSEVHPISILEALACGCPVLGTRGPAIEEIIRDGQEGLLAQPNREDFGAKLLKMVEDRELRTLLSGRAQARGLQYSVRRTAGAVYEIYLRVIEAARKHPRCRMATRESCAQNLESARPVHRRNSASAGREAVNR